MTAQLTRQQRRKAERKALAEGWTPLREIQPDATTIAGDMGAVARRSGVSENDVREAAEAIFETARFYASDKYEVTVRDADEPGWTHLAIRRTDGQRDIPWRDRQRIKNELVGPECEGVELHPAESRLADMTNTYHLWVNGDPRFRLDLGFHDGRQVQA